VCSGKSRLPTAPMSSIGALIIRLTHTGVYADGRPNTASVTIYDLDQDILKMNRQRSVPIPPNSTVDIVMSSESFISYNKGSIRQFLLQGLLRAEILLQLRDSDNYGGPAGTGQTLRPGVLNVERVGGVLRLVIPDNAIPANVDSAGYLVGEPLEIVGLTNTFRNLNGKYTVSRVVPGSGLAGAAAGSYLVEVPSPGPNIAAVVHAAGVVLRLLDGRLTVEFTSDGNLSGLGANVFGYVAGQLLPGTGGGGSALAVQDEGVLIDAATSTLNFVGAGVTAATGGPGIVTITVPGSAGASTLAQVLVAGNATGGSSVLVSSGDAILGQTNLELSPGAGVGDNVIIDGLTWPSADGVAGTALVTDGLGVLSFAAPTPAAHATTHVRSGTDAIDGDLLDVDYVPANYTRTLTPPTTSLEELTSHLRGIDLALGAAGGAATAIVTWGVGSVSASTATRYLLPSWDAGMAPLNPVAWRSPRGGTLRNFRVRHNSPAGNGGIVVYTVRVNGVATTVTVPLASNASDGSDLLNSVVVAAGDLIDVRVTKAADIASGTLAVTASAEMAA
jgi:hypothetical protein